MVSNAHISVTQFPITTDLPLITITVNGNCLQSPPLHPRYVQVSSEYVCQMAEESLLIPDKNLNLQDCVGQGEVYIYSVYALENY